MRLYAIKNTDTNEIVGHYWAEDGSMAVMEHRRYTLDEAPLKPDIVWANNENKAYRGYVIMEDNKLWNIK